MDLRSSDEQKEQESGTNLYHHLMAKRKELVEEPKIVLQRLIVIGRLPCSVGDRTELGAHFEKLIFKQSKQHVWDNITGLLLIYPSCLLHVIESTRDVLVSVVKDARLKQKQPDCILQEAKILFLAHGAAKRMFQQWSYKVVTVDQVVKDVRVKGHKEDKESTKTLVCRVLSALQKLATHLQLAKEAPTGSVLDETPDLFVPQKNLQELLGRGEFLSPDQFLQMYDSPLHVSMDFGQVTLQNILPTV